MLCLRCVYFFVFMLRKSFGLLLNIRVFVFKKNCIFVCYIDIKFFYIMFVFIFGVYWCRFRYIKLSVYIMFVLFLKKEL